MIPLNQIWANQMPGTRDIWKLGTKRPLVYEIQCAVGSPPNDKETDPGFAVFGRGLAALREAHAVLVGTKQRRDTFPMHSEISAVFFTHEMQPHVHLDKVERIGNDVNVYYQFIFHENTDTERYIALIPLGNLEAGKYRVNIDRSPVHWKDFRRLQVDDHLVICHSFSFTVSDDGK